MSSPRRLLALLTIVNLLNYLDRYVVSALVGDLKASELHVTDAQAGLLMTSFLLAYMVTSPFFAAMSGRISRPKLLAFGVLAWSIATSLSGFARTFPELILARAFVGIGEAAYATLAPVMIADAYPADRRGRVYSIFYAAIPIGSALGYIFGGLMSAHWGWRIALGFSGLPGIALALLVYLLKDPSPTAKKDAPGVAAIGAVLRKRPYVQTVLAYAAYTFGLGGLAFWMPTFLTRVRGLPIEKASLWFGGSIVVTGFVGTLLGGWLGDRLRKRFPNSHEWICGLSTLLAVPATYFALRSPMWGILIPCMILGQFLLFLSTSPVNTVISEKVSPGQRAAAFAMCNLLIHLFGDVPSPPLIGWISDQTHLETGLLLVPVALFVGGFLWMRSASAAGQRTAS